MGKFSMGGKKATSLPIIKEKEFIKNSKTQGEKTGRGNYKRISFNLPPELVKELRNYSLDLKDSGEKDSGVSTIVARACIQYLNEKGVDIEEGIIVEKIVRE
jgi:hypothetical protein